MASLHQMRISQVPLRPADPADLNAQNQNQVFLEEEEEAPMEKLSSLDHVRYNIVGRGFFLFILFFFSFSNQKLFPASQQARKFIIRLAHALMEFGAPMHKIDEQLAAACEFLSIKASFVLFNTVIIMVFEDPDGALPTRKHFIQRPQGLSLAQLQRTHTVYSAVIHDRISAVEGTRQLKEITDHPDTYGFYVKILIAFLAGFAICPMGFSGSFIDGLIAGASSAFLMTVQLLRGGDVLFTGIFEYVAFTFLIGFANLAIQDCGGNLCFSGCPVIEQHRWPHILL